MNLKRARKLSRKVQWDLTIATGIPQGKISLIENGYIQPTIDEKNKLAAALDLAVSDIHWPEVKTARC